jgi:hypothetical protein
MFAITLRRYYFAVLVHGRSLRLHLHREYRTTDQRVRNRMDPGRIDVWSWSVLHVSKRDEFQSPMLVIRILVIPSRPRVRQFQLLSKSLDNFLFDVIGIPFLRWRIVGVEGQHSQGRSGSDRNITVDGWITTLHPDGLREVETSFR